MNQRLFTALNRLFEKHRIVFWYDAERELRAEYEALSFDNVEKIELNSNEFQIKYRILREAPTQKFLLFHEGERPADTSNWLLDVLLAQAQFSTDQLGMWLSELELGPEFRELVAEHFDFFKAGSRREALKAILETTDSLGKTRLKMMGVCLKCEPRVDAILEAGLNELANGQDKGSLLLTKFMLDGHLWRQAQGLYGYRSENPGQLDFAIELFKSAYDRVLDGTPKLNQDASILLQRWKNNRRFTDQFESLSIRFSDELDIKEALETMDYRSLVETDLFQEIDQRIIRSLIDELSANSISPENCSEVIRRRRQSHWYERYADMYLALDYAAGFRKRRLAFNADIRDFDHGIDAYSTHWHELDFYYRKFIHHANFASQPTLFNSLRTQIEQHYTNSFLLPLNNNWQTKVDASDRWHSSGFVQASSFFSRFVQPKIGQGQKMVVFISDALRYEAAWELVSRIRHEDRFDAEIEPMLSMLPSYTQLGMAALLPHDTLELLDSSKATITADGQSTVGTENRSKVINKAVESGAIAVQARDLIQLDRNAARELFREHSVIYVYHNRIDATGDKRDTEEQVFKAVEDTLVELVDLIKRMANANATNMLVTSDHGFIYQDKAIEESDFLAAEPEGDSIYYRDRRFVIGLGLKEQGGLKTWTAKQLGLAGDEEFQIPKSINRLRLRGSGSRFVHGGSSLQEIVVPVVHINKKRRSDVGRVEIDLIQSTSTITSNQLTVSFYQTEPVNDKLQARRLRAAFYSPEGEAISGIHDLIFDHASDNSREREQKVQFFLTHDADKSSGQEVELRLDEPIEGTSQFRKYKYFKYMLRISFSSDFDF
ncbi:BREX-1 system phosphatase PglZ type A [Pseudomonadota bacterium]